MRLTFVSNYINHHQIPISNELYQSLKENYHFVQTQPMEEERVQMGWQEALEECPYVRNYWENEKECKTLILESDVVIFGGVEEESYLADRLEAGKLVIRYSERIYRNGLWRAISPRGLMKKYHDHVRYRNAPVYLLCSGAYVAFDFSLIHAYPNKKYKWGYFPKTKEYEIAKLLEKKSSDVTKLLWVSRLIELKHPEWIILLARELKLSINEKFQIEMVGDGPLRHSLEILIEEYGVSDVVHLEIGRAHV